MIIYLPYELAYFIVEYIMNGFLYLHFLYPLGLRQLSESKKLFRYKTLSIIEVSMLNFGYLLLRLMFIDLLTKYLFTFIIIYLF